MFIFRVVVHHHSTQSTYIHHAQLGFKNESPTNFELSVLLLTREPERAATWLSQLPMKLPPEPGLDVPGAVPALRYIANVPYTREAPYAPFTYGRAAPEERERVRAQILGCGCGGGVWREEGVEACVCVDYGRDGRIGGMCM